MRKLSRRPGQETVAELSRSLIAKAERETRFRARAVGIDSTRRTSAARPTAAWPRTGCARSPARGGGCGRSWLGRRRGSAILAGGRQAPAGDLAHAAAPEGRGQGRGARADRGDGQAPPGLGAGGARSCRRGAPEGAGASALGEGEGEAAGGRDPRRRRAPGDLAERGEKVVEQIRKRLAGEPSTDRLVSPFDPDARPIRKGKLGRPTEFGYLEQPAELTPSTKPGARGFILPPASAPGNPGENEPLPDTAAELRRLGLQPREVALDGGFQTKASEEALAPLAPGRAFIAGRSEPSSRRTRRRLGRYRAGGEGRTSHLKRRHGRRRSRPKGGEGERTWTGWGCSPTTSRPTGCTPEQTRRGCEAGTPPRAGRATPPCAGPSAFGPIGSLSVYPGEVA